MLVWFLIMITVASPTTASTQNTKDNTNTNMDPDPAETLDHSINHHSHQENDRVEEESASIHNSPTDRHHQENDHHHHHTTGESQQQQKPQEALHHSSPQDTTTDPNQTKHRDPHLDNENDDSHRSSSWIMNTEAGDEQEQGQPPNSTTTTTTNVDHADAHEIDHDHDDDTNTTITRISTTPPASSSPANGEKASILRRHEEETRGEEHSSLPPSPQEHLDHINNHHHDSSAAPNKNNSNHHHDEDPPHEETDEEELAALSTVAKLSDGMDDLDDRSLLDVFAEASKEYLTQHMVRATRIMSEGFFLARMILASTSMQCVGGKEAFSSSFVTLEEEKSPCGFFLTNLIIFLFRCFTSLIFVHTDPTHGRRMPLGLAVVAVRTRVRMSFPRTMGRLSCRPIVSSLVVVIQRTRALCTRRSFSGLTRGSHSQESHFARHTNPRNSPFQTNTRRTKAHQTC